LDNGTMYNVWIKARNDYGSGAFSEMVSGTPNITPSAPAAPTLTVEDEQLKVEWSVVSFASAYEVWFGASSDSSSATQFGDDVDGVSATITGLTNGTTYYVWLKAKNNVGTSGFSSSANAKPNVVPNAPDAPVLTAGNERITAAWSAVTGAESYEVWYGTSSENAEQFGLDISAEGTLQATITGLTNGTTYSVWLKAKNSAGTSGFSGGTSVSLIGSMGSITAASGIEQLYLSWSAVTFATSYEVFYRTSNTMPSTPAQTVIGTSTILAGLTNNETYYIWVRPKNATQTGTAARTTGIPLPPIEVSLNITSDAPDEWDIVSERSTVAQGRSNQFTVSGTYAEYAWYLDGVHVGSSSSYLFDGSGKTPGVSYELVVVVANTAGEKRSGRCRILVTEGSAYQVGINIKSQEDLWLVSPEAFVPQNGVRAFTVYGAYSAYQWYLDGSPAGTGPSYSFDAENRPLGETYEVTVVVATVSGEKYSGRVRVKITEED
jgi:hypothetical protein